MRENMAWLQVTQYPVWTSRGHCYGTLIHRDERVEVEYQLSTGEAKKLNRQDANVGYKMRPGSTTSRFFTREQLVGVAIELCKGKFPTAEYLLLGNVTSASPEQVLFGPRMDELNELCEQFECARGRDERNAVSAKWDEIMGIEWE